MNIILIIITIYVISIIGAWFEINWLHLNRWKYINPDIADLFATFAPVINTVFLIRYCYHRISPNLKLNKFYKIPERKE